MIAKKIKGYEELDESTICYWHADDHKAWLIYFPNCGIGNLKAHIVIEHEDGTISVTPSILMTGHDSGKPVTVHGYLTRGQWNPC